MPERDTPYPASIIYDVYDVISEDITPFADIRVLIRRRMPSANEDVVADYGKALVQQLLDSGYAELYREFPAENTETHRAAVRIPPEENASLVNAEDSWVLPAGDDPIITIELIQAGWDAWREHGLPRLKLPPPNESQ